VLLNYKINRFSTVDDIKLKLLTKLNNNVSLYFMARVSSTMIIIIKVLKKKTYVTRCSNVHVDQIIIKIKILHFYMGGKLEEK